MSRPTQSRSYDDGLGDKTVIFGAGLSAASLEMAGERGLGRRPVQVEPPPTPPSRPSTRTTQLYDRLREELTLDEAERIGI